MRSRTRTLLTALSVMLAAPAVAAQNGTIALAAHSADTTAVDTATAKPAKASAASLLVRPTEIQHLREQDQRGLNVFETPKETTVPFEGFKLSFGAAFTQQFQALDHENAAAPNVVNGVNLNQLQEIGAGFNNATANLYLNAQLAPGIRVALTTYLSSRHHNEAWVKDGYLLVDQSPLDVAVLEEMMKYVTLKVGHFEVNYGDAHFRRTDNGNAMYNPFIGNLILDAFTTQIGGEVYAQANGFLVMGGITGGEIRGNVTRPDDRSFAYLGKLGYDRQLTKDLRFRLTGSTFQQAKAISNTLYSGDRAGSRYYWVMDNTQGSEASNFRSGLIVPGFGSKVKSYMINPFVKYRRLELFGVAETAEGRNASEAEDRQWTQYAADAVYRFLPGDRLYVGARYNTVEGELPGFATEVSVDRTALAAGWFITPSVLLKGEWVTQKYNHFPTTDIRSGGKFDGLIVEGVVAF